MLIRDVNVATHLYHIAQEAVNNAIKHGGASAIDLALRPDAAGPASWRSGTTGSGSPRARGGTAPGWGCTS